MFRLRVSIPREDTDKGVAWSYSHSYGIVEGNGWWRNG